MRRAELLRLTGLDAVSFNALVRKGWRPAGAASGSKGWSDYRFLDVFLLDLTVMLNATGPTQVEAATLVRTDAYRVFDAHPHYRDVHGANVWFGFALVASEEVDPETRRPLRAAYVRPMAGPMAAINRDLEAVARVPGQAADVIGLVNASQRLRVLLGRAQELHIMHAIEAELEEPPQLRSEADE